MNNRICQENKFPARKNIFLVYFEIIIFFDAVNLRVSLRADNRALYYVTPLWSTLWCSRRLSLGLFNTSRCAELEVSVTFEELTKTWIALKWNLFKSSQTLLMSEDLEI